MRITLDFGDGIVREYTADEKSDAYLLDGATVNVKFKHPRIEEFLKIKYED